jgi:hypothetical protein
MREKIEKGHHVKMILDLGSGPGDYLLNRHRLAEGRGEDVLLFGVEPDRETFNAASRRIKKSQAMDVLNINMPVEELPEQMKFDEIVILAPEPEPEIKDIRAIAGGKLEYPEGMLNYNVGSKISGALKDKGTVSILTELHMMNFGFQSEDARALLRNTTSESQFIDALEKMGLSRLSVKHVLAKDIPKDLCYEGSYLHKKGFPVMTLLVYGKSASSLTSLVLDERGNRVLAQLIEEGIIDKNVYKAGSLEYEGLIQIMRNINSTRYEIEILKRWQKHNNLAPKGDLVREASYFLGWVNKSLGENAVNTLFFNLILNKEILAGQAHMILIYLLHYDWDLESIRYFIRLIGRSKEEGASAWADLIWYIRDYRFFKEDSIKINEETRKKVFIDILNELERQNRPLSVEEVREVVLIKMRERSSASSLKKNNDDLEGIDGSTKLAIDSRDTEVGGIDMSGLKRQMRIERNEIARNDTNGAGLAMASSPELQEIQKMIQAGIIPSTSRLEECGKSCQAQALISCIADILRMEEEQVTPTDTELKELLSKL